jgi:hypothetical protein
MNNRSAQSRQGAGIVSALVAALALGFATAAQAGTLTTTTLSDITAFESGAFVETFDTVPGLAISSYPTAGNPGPTVPAADQQTALTPSGASQPTFFNSGGATFTDPVGNPGTPIGIFTPSGGIAGDVLSGHNVAGGLIGMTSTAFTDGNATAFMEVIFPTDMSKVGLYVAHGQVLLILKNDGNNNLSTGDFMITGTAGQYIGLTRTSPDVKGVTMIFTGVTTIDDFTFGNGSSTSGSGGKVPDAGSPLNLALAGGCLVVLGRKLKARTA